MEVPWGCNLGVASEVLQGKPVEPVHLLYPQRNRSAPFCHLPASALEKAPPVFAPWVPSTPAVGLLRDAPEISRWPGRHRGSDAQWEGGWDPNQGPLIQPLPHPPGNSCLPFTASPRPTLTTQENAGQFQEHCKVRKANCRKTYDWCHFYKTKTRICAWICIWYKCTGKAVS